MNYIKIILMTSLLSFICSEVIGQKGPLYDYEEGCNAEVLEFKIECDLCCGLNGAYACPVDVVYDEWCEASHETEYYDSCGNCYEIFGPFDDYDWDWEIHVYENGWNADPTVIKVDDYQKNYDGWTVEIQFDPYEGELD